jgi:hypothetical protein
VKSANNAPIAIDSRSNTANPRAIAIAALNNAQPRTSVAQRARGYDESMLTILLVALLLLLLLGGWGYGYRSRP